MYLIILRFQDVGVGYPKPCLFEQTRGRSIFLTSTDDHFVLAEAIKNNKSRYQILANKL